MKAWRKWNHSCSLNEREDQVEKTTMTSIESSVNDLLFVVPNELYLQKSRPISNRKMVDNKDDVAFAAVTVAVLSESVVC
jgi:hypothetical protein